eukprot:scaffold8679_cov121-Isochrysis_galbana.AAC.18
MAKSQPRVMGIKIDWMWRTRARDVRVLSRSTCNGQWLMCTYTPKLQASHSRGSCRVVSATPCASHVGPTASPLSLAAGREILELLHHAAPQPRLP